MATIKEVAQCAGVSTATVSKYLHGAVLKERNRIAVENAIAELNYKINPAAQGLRTGKSMTIGILIPELDNLFSTSIVSVIENTLMQNGYSTIICDYKTSRELEIEKLHFLINRMVDGIVIMPVSITAEDLSGIDVPAVIIDRLVKNTDADTVIIDNAGAAYDAVHYLIENGHKEIGILLGPENIYTSEERLKGYEKALEESGIPINRSYIMNGNFDIVSGHDMTIQLLELDNPPTAVFATNYELTLGAVMAFNESNVAIPDELSFVGFDNLELARVIKPGLTGITQPLDEIGEIAAKLLLERIDGGRESNKTVVLDTSMIIQDSVRKHN